MRIVVAGAGMAGLATALALARAGHSVQLVERDALNTSDDPNEAFRWNRKGIAHFQQPHAFLPRSRRELKQLFPDVYSALLDAGASDYSIAEKIRGERRREDDELVYLSVRRPVIEWALRKAVLSESQVEVRQARVTDLLLEVGEAPKVSGVALDSGERLQADLVVDAQGRTSSFPAKLANAGVRIPTETSSTHIVYYSRYFQMKPGRVFPRGPWLTTPRGDFGYAGYSSFTGDNGTFALVFAIGSWDRELRLLQHEAAWDAAAKSIKRLAELTDPEFAEPVTPVLAMGELQNTLRRFVDDGKPLVRGFVPVGDSLCHLDPTFALGLSFAIIHAKELRNAIGNASGADSILPEYWKAIYPETRERFDYSVAADEARARMWRGEKLDVFHAAGAYPIFTMVAASMAALQDDDVLRKTMRRIGFLDRMSVFDDDPALHRKIEGIVEKMFRSMTPVKMTGREELIAVMGRAVAQG